MPTQQDFGTAPEGFGLAGHNQHAGGVPLARLPERHGTVHKTGQVAEAVMRGRGPFAAIVAVVARFRSRRGARGGLGDAHKMIPDNLIVEESYLVHGITHILAHRPG